MIRNKLKYLIFLFAMIVLSILYNEYMMGILLLTIILIPFFLIAVLVYSYRRVTATLCSVIHVANKGELLPVSVMLNNPTIFPVSNLALYITYKNSFSEKEHKKEIIVSIDRRTGSNVICNLRSEYTGNLEISMTGIRHYDFINLFSLKKKMNQKIKIAILPDLYEISEQKLKIQDYNPADSDYFSAVKSGDDPSEVFAIREYREGDKPTRIHWKLSRKHNQIMIKEFSDPINCSILLYLHLRTAKGKNGLAMLDSLIESAFSLSYTLLLKGQIHYLAWYDKEYHGCKRVQIMQENDLFEALDGIMQSLPAEEAADVMSSYLAQYPKEYYTDFIYFADDSGYLGLESVDLIHAVNKQMILIQNAEEPIDEVEDRVFKEVSKEVVLKTAELGIDLFPVGAGNVKEDMCGFQLG